jgi:hypothetical protein
VGPVAETGVEIADPHLLTRVKSATAPIRRSAQWFGNRPHGTHEAAE